MLKITLYKDCILNETYENVFSTGNANGKSILEKYLDTLEKIEIEIENTYQTNRGTLYFDYEINLKNIYDFNYMKVETIENIEPKITRYCFVQNIELSNELVKLTYIEDIWSSYSNKIKGTTESYLNKLRFIDYENNLINNYNLEKNYEGNNGIFIEKTNLEQKGVNLVVQLQWYETDQKGIATKRQVRNFLISYYKKPEGTPEPEEIFTFTNVEEIVETINLYMYLMGGKNLSYLGGESSEAPNFYFEIEKVYAVPKMFNMESHIKTNPMFVLLNPQGFIPSGIDKTMFVFFREIYDMEDNVSRFFTFKNDFKRLGIGTYTHINEVENNGTSLEAKIRLFNDRYNFKILLEYQNKIIEITNDFLVNVPYTQLNGEINAQQKISRTIENLLMTSSSINTLRNYGSAYKKFGTELALSILFPKTALQHKDADKDFIDATNKTSNNLLQTFAKRKLLNAPIYSTTKGVNVSSEGILNGLNGFISTSLISDNDNFVKKYINNYGYNVYTFIDNFSVLKINEDKYFSDKKVNYNVYGFSTINVYGSFPRNIALILNSILENGVKVWYNERMLEDSYKVG